MHGQFPQDFWEFVTFCKLCCTNFCKSADFSHVIDTLRQCSWLDDNEEATKSLGSSLAGVINAFQLNATT